MIVPKDASPILRQVLRDWIHPPELLIESDYAIDDDAFADRLIALYSSLQP